MRVAVVGAAVAVLTSAAACGGPGGIIAEHPPADGGWIDGPPEMGPSTGAGAAEMRADVEFSADAAMGETVAEPSTPDEGTPLRAGNIDDNEDFEGFLAYLERVTAAGVAFRSLDPTGRVVITVQDPAARPVAGAVVTVAEGDTERAVLRTTADGTVRFHPRAHGAGDGPFAVSVGDSLVESPAGGAVTVETDVAPLPDTVPLDIAFAIDTTGSMGDELERLKTSVASVVERIEALPGTPDVRLAMTAYRDEGDSFVTATHDFTSDIDAFRTALGELSAGGGGDTPEAVDEALDEILAAPAWRPAGEATQLVFLVGDAGGHPERNVARAYPDSMTDAATRGIKIIPIAASSTNDQAEVAFRQMAQFTGARFIFLAYGAAGAAVGGSTDITTTDYEELSLDDLIVRLVADELEARTGTPITVPPTPTTTTVPPGQ